MSWRKDRFSLGSLGTLCVIRSGPGRDGNLWWTWQWCSSFEDDLMMSEESYSTRVKARRAAESAVDGLLKEARRRLRMVRG
jgi:hypothetical protein